MSATDTIDEQMTDEQKAMQFILFLQTVATARNVPVKKRYIALATDFLALSKGETKNYGIHTKALI